MLQEQEKAGEQEAPQGKARAIERIHRPTYEDFYHNYVLKSRPVIITGVADKWDAVAKWNAEYLRSCSEDTRVEIVVSKNQATIARPEKGWQTHRMLDMGLHEFLNTVENSEKLKRYYYLQYQKANIFPGAQNDFAVPDFIPRKAINTRVWVGSGRNITPLHHDTQSNVLTQVRGRKKFTLFSPAESRSFYPFPFYAKSYTLSPVNLKEPDYEKYPRFKKAHPLEGVLEPGEMIFQPVFWWHQVETLSSEMAISVTFMWEAPRRSYGTYLGLRTLGSRIVRGTHE